MRAASLLAVAKILFGCGLTVAVSYVLGRWFLLATGAWRLLARGERLVFAFGMGAAWLSSLVFALSVAQLAYPAVFLVLGVLLLGAGLRYRAGPEDPAPVAEAASRGLWLLVPVAAAYGYLYLMHAMAPEISPDGARYHLGLVSRYLREHGFSRITTNLYAMLSQGVEMLFLFAYAFGRHSAAKMTHFAFLAATVGALISFGRRFRLGPAAAVAAAFYACSPVVGVDGAASYNDCALALYTFLTFYLLLLWEHSRAPALWPAIGVAAGFCFSIKYTGFLALPFALGFLIWKAKPRIAPALRVAVFASLFIAPWMVKNAIVVENPVAPFLNRFFPNPYLHVSFERAYTHMMRHYSGLGEQNWKDYLQIPWELALRGGKLHGLVGPLFLLAPLGLWSLRQKMGRRVWAAAAIFALPWLSNIGTRFLIPSLVFLSLALALAIWQVPRRAAPALAAVLVVVHAVGSWPSVVGRWNREPIWRLGPPEWKAALRIEPEDEYLSRAMPEYNVAQMIERVVPPGGRVFSPSGVAEAYTSREVLVSYTCGLCEVLMDHLLNPVVPDFAPGWNYRWEWAPRDLTAVRLVQTGSDPAQMWSIHELLLFSGEDYQVPKPSWLLRARPNPWDAALAMDGNPATRWRSWRPLHPGMRFQVDFPEPLRLSALEVRCSADQQKLALELEARDAAGGWSPLAAQRNRGDRNPPREEMRKLATSELKQRGVDYLLTDLRGEGMDLIAPPIASDPGGWGLREVGGYGPIRLYYIE